MDLNEFETELKSNLNEININLEKNMIKNLFDYMKLVLEWNEKINLTAITDEKEFIIKHIVDSLTVLPFINNYSKVIDVGTGAGFPGIPLKIANPTLEITLLDSLNKRLNFLQLVIEKLKLKKIEIVHSRVEDFGRECNNREKFDIAIARAVAPLNVLVEYLIPITKVNGKSICMKSLKSEEEISNSKKALQVLNGTIEKNVEITLPKSEIKRNIIIVNKGKETLKIYPRKAGTPSKSPIA